ncbi:hypothetical protein VSR82_34180 [Burkholderia sp. JPY481]|uniref:hypothetical protein n=1 Tax=Paraburkholderia sp. JPY465 TaxID=3042285 RepID=UPI00316BB348
MNRFHGDIEVWQRRASGDRSGGACYLSRMKRPAAVGRDPGAIANRRFGDACLDVSLDGPLRHPLLCRRMKAGQAPACSTKLTVNVIRRRRYREHGIFVPPNAYQAKYGMNIPIYCFVRGIPIFTLVACSYRSAIREFLCPIESGHLI